ncbi:hypothetical protein ACQ4PT_059184 [Festuca glaucescens]
MSWSSSGSSAPGFRAATGRRGAVTERRSPVVYRDNPMAYEPVKLCYCNPRKKAPRWISWSEQNPGRRYYTCVDAMNGGGYGYVEWHDPPLPDFWSDLLGDLRDEVWKLRGQGQGAAAGSVQGEGSGTMVLELQEQLKEKEAQIAAMKRKYENLFFLFIVFVVGLVARKMLMQ